MSVLLEVKAADINMNAIEAFGRDWGGIVAKKNDGSINAMTIAWGGVGCVWNKDTVTVYIRQTRYTKEFVDEAGCFSLCFPDHEKYGDALKYLGSVSGRIEDKIKKCGLTVAENDGIPYFEESSVVFLCRVLCSCDLMPDCVADEIRTKWYTDDSWHTMYIAEIEKTLIKRNI